MMDKFADSDRTQPDYGDMRVLVAGGSSGIGFASAHKLAGLGVKHLALMANNEERLEAAQRALEMAHPATHVHTMPFDAVDPRSVAEKVPAAVDLLGGVDAMIASISAPAYRPVLLHDVPLADIQDIMLAQATPPMLVARAVLPFMREQKHGAIVTVASDAAKAPTPGEAVLGAAMAAIVMFTRTLAIEGKRDGIRANVLTPSLLTGTPTTERALADGFSKKLFERAASGAQLGVPSKEDQAELVAFLVGPAAGRLTGQAISVNGGISAL